MRVVTEDGGPLADYHAQMLAAGRSPLTIRARMEQATALHRALDPLTCTEADLIRYLARPDLAPATRASLRAGVRAYIGFLHRARLRPDNPSERLPTVRQPPPAPHPAPEAALLRARTSAGDAWERLMVDLAARAGLRRAEIAGLKFSDVESEPGGAVLRIKGKGSRTRSIPIPPDLAEAIAARRSDWVFPGRYPGTHASPNHVGEVLSRLLGDAGTAHSLRHRYATKVYGASRDLLATQRLLGHSSPVTTQVYVAIPPDDLRGAASAAS